MFGTLQTQHSLTQWAPLGPLRSACHVIAQLVSNASCDSPQLEPWLSKWFQATCCHE